MSRKINRTVDEVDEALHTSAFWPGLHMGWTEEEMATRQSNLDQAREGDLQDTRDVKIQTTVQKRKQRQSLQYFCLLLFNPRQQEYSEGLLPVTYLKVSKLCSKPC